MFDRVAFLHVCDERQIQRASSKTGFDSRNVLGIDQRVLGENSIKVWEMMLVVNKNIFGKGQRFFNIRTRASQ